MHILNMGKVITYKKMENIIKLNIYYLHHLLEIGAIIKEDFRK